MYPHLGTPGLHSAYNLFNIFRSEEYTIFESLSIFIRAISCMALSNFRFANLYVILNWF